nr:12042_t:CDS:2 [Entrophospora candida]CAG8642214.1 8574_t:CDS:2 [Entrophospora candida]
MKTFIAIITALIVILSSVLTANAFCIYNKIDIDVDVSVGSNIGHFFGKIAPGANKCCNYKDTSCNPTGAQDAVLDLDISSSCGCDKEAQIYAGGWCDITGTTDLCPKGQPTHIMVAVRPICNKTVYHNSEF